ncbi:MAG: hypothetical protein ACPGOY_09665 [Rhodospirillaceae bacterium]
MAYELRFEGNGFFIEFTGLVSFDEIAEANDLLYTHAAWDTHQYQIWSFLDAGAIDGEKRDSRVISKVDERTLGDGRDSPVRIAFMSTNAKSNEIITAYLDAVDESRFVGTIVRTEEAARAFVKDA